VSRFARSGYSMAPDRWLPSRCCRPQRSD
jgi:hypothetical protein